MATGGRLILPLSEPSISNTLALQSGATLTVYIAGGNVLASLYADAALSTPITNPQTSNSAGRFYQQSTSIWADDSQAYDCVLSFPDGESFTYDSVYLVGPPVNTAGFAPINSPAFTGVPTAPTPALNDNSQKLATTGFVAGQGFAVLNSPAFTGVPTAPTAAGGTNTTQIATTAFVTAALGATLPTGVAAGYLKLGSIYIQWQSFSIGASPGSTVSVVWPIAFPTNIVGDPWVAFSGATAGGYMLGCTAKSTTGATFNKNASDPSAHTGTVFAIGY